LVAEDVAEFLSGYSRPTTHSPLLPSGTPWKKTINGRTTRPKGVEAMSEVRLVPLEQIPWEECLAFQCREQMSEEHIHQLTELVTESDEEQQQKGAPLRNDLFPPLVVFTRGGLTDLYYLAEGFHRYESLERAGRDAWLCEVHVVEDPLFAAKEYSLKANTNHGLKRDAATCQRVFMKARAMFPTLQLYGKEGIEGKTGLSRGFIYRQLVRLKKAGTPDIHVPQSLRRETPSDRPREKPSEPTPAAETARVERMDAKANPNRTNPNCEPLPKRDVGTSVEEIAEALPETRPAETRPAEAAPGEAQTRGKLVDKLNRPVPPGLRGKHNTAAVAEWVRRLGMLISEVDGLAGKPGWEYLDVAAAGRGFKTIQNQFRGAEYYTECPRCDAVPNCKLCKGAGFITPLQHARLDDREKGALKD